MPQFRHGKNTRIFVDGYELSRSLKNVTTQQQMDTGETTGFTSTQKSYVAGIPEMSVNADGMFAFDSVTLDNIDNVLQAVMAVETPIAISVAFDNGVTAGKLVKAGQALETDINVNSSITDIVATTAAFKVTDAFFSGISLRDPDSVLALTGVASSGVGQDMTAFATHITPSIQMKNGGIAVLHVIANTVNSTTTLKFQHSTLIGGTYVDFATFTIPANTKAGYTFVVPAGALDKFIKYNITATGTGNLQFLAVFAPRTASIQVA